jgi:hypothetical protein
MNQTFHGRTYWSPLVVPILERLKLADVLIKPFP